MTATNADQSSQHGVASATAERLLETAERLFAEEGIDSVSLNKIRKEAGARNASAMQYYFGDRRSLVVAILERRTAVINARRLALLADIGKLQGEPAIRTIVQALVLPFAEQMTDANSVRYYVRFVDQVYRAPQLEFSSLLSERFASGIRQAIRELELHLKHLPRKKVHARFHVVQGLIIHALADRERRMLWGSQKRTSASSEAFNGLLVDMCVGALMAPASSA